MSREEQVSSSRPAWSHTSKEKIIGVLDVVIALMGFALTLPVTFLIAIIIKMDSLGPAIFKQTRIGKDRRQNGFSISRIDDKSSQDRRTNNLGGRPFTLYKLRTMYVDAKERYPELYRYQYSPEEISTMYFKIPDDPRLTRFGLHLRKTTLDELPNLINVINGGMSLVGPRPDIPEMIKYYEPWQRKKFQVKPGHYSGEWPGPSVLPGNSEA